MTICAGCGCALVKGATRARIQNCDREQKHVFHPDCASPLGQYDPCPGCLASCRFCGDHVADKNIVTLCEASNHHVYHESCLAVQDLGELSDCPACLKEDRESRIAPPCAPCGERIRDVAWSLGDCGHAMHSSCLESWDRGRIVGCLACNLARPVCPCCGRDFKVCGGHVLARCPREKCRARVFEELIGAHDCSLRASGDKPCMRCAKPVSGHETLCTKELASLIRWDAARPGHFLYVCALCSEAVPDLAAHFADEHRPVRCRACGFAVAKHVAREHVESCGGSKTCPAEACKEIVSGLVIARARSDPGALWKDHECSGLYACAFDCGAFFYKVDEMERHASDCATASGAVRAPATRKRRRAFDKSNEFVLACSSLNQVDQ